MKNKALKFKWRAFKGLLLAWAVLFGSVAGLQAHELEVKNTLPPLKQLVEIAHSHYGNPNPSGSGHKIRETDIIFEVKKNYFLIQAKNAQLDISREVKGHFEKAVKTAQEKFDEGEEAISQSAITKLKLGLSGTLNDILKFESEKDLARLEMQNLLGWSIAPDFKLERSGFSPPNFPHKTVQDFLRHQGIDPSAENLSTDQKVSLEKEMIQVQRFRGVYELANKNRKMTRALLVTEVANYDFGIGDEGDLFEALIIYTRLLVGYNETLYEYNLAVLNLEKLWAQMK